MSPSHLSAFTHLTQVLPEQLLDRSVVKVFGALSVGGKVTEVEDGKLIIQFEDEEIGEYELTVSEVLASLVGPPPEAIDEHDQPPPTEEETAEAQALNFKSRRQTLAKNHPSIPKGQAGTPQLRALADAEWPGLSAEKKVHWLKKAREKLGGTGNAAQPAAERTLKRGDPVPPLLYGRDKGMEARLVERGLPSGLRGACASEEAHGVFKAQRSRRPSEHWPDDFGATFPPSPFTPADGRPYVSFLRNSCCCKRLLAVQPDFRSERSALERVVAKGGHRCLFLPKFHCELNWIERYWGAAKKYARRHCSYSLSGLRTIVPIALSQSLDELPEELRNKPDLPVSPLFKQRRWARISWQYCIEYRKGESGDAVFKAVMAQRSKRHRDTSDARSRQAEARMEAAAFAAM